MLLAITKKIFTEGNEANEVFVSFVSFCELLRSHLFRALWLLAFLLFAGLAHGQIIGRPPAILTQPQSLLAAAGSNVTFTVAVAPSASLLSYQWRFNGFLLSGATTTNLTLTNIAFAKGGNYKVTVANAAGTTTSDPATLTVLSTVQAPPSVSLGASVSLSFFAAPSAGLSFQWQSNGTTLPVSSSKLSLANAQLADATAYSLVVSNAGSSLVFPTPLNIDPAFTKITTGPIVTDAGGAGGAATWGDYNNDGFIDLFVARAGAGNWLYRNNGDGTFTRIMTGTIATDPGNSVGGVWGDYDNDGFLDLFVANTGGGSANYLYHNNGDGTFTRILAGPIAAVQDYSQAGVWGDYDNDGLLDLFVSHSIDGANVLYHNNGGGAFSLASAGSLTSDHAYFHGASWGDFNNDGLLDLFESNDGTTVNGNFLYQNNGQGSFTRRIVTENGIFGSCAWGDYDNDGFLDLFVGNFNFAGTYHNILYHNNGDGTFTRVANAGPIVTDSGNALDCAWADYDNDGYLDLFVANGLNNLLYHNKGDGTFEKITTGSLANDQDSNGRGSRSCTWGDYDNDGFLDLFAGNALSSGNVNYLYRNNGNSNGWLKLKCIGTVSNRSAIGAKVRIKATIRGKTFWQVREISGGSGNGGQNGLLPHFGLGDATNIDIVRIEWPSGIVQELRNVKPNQVLAVTEQGAASGGPRLSGVLRPSGAFEITLNGASRSTVAIEGSQDLLTWIRLGTLTNAISNTHFIDQAARNFRQRFYRAVAP